MNPTILDAIQSLRPTAEWDYCNGVLNWKSSEIPQPTEAEIQAELARLIAEYPRQLVRQQRAAAYAAESDPIFFKAQRGEATMDDWRTAVAAIQLSFPYPDEEVIK